MLGTYYRRHMHGSVVHITTLETESEGANGKAKRKAISATNIFNLIVNVASG